MLDAITASHRAMEMDQLQLQTISNNIANMNTPGFKRQILEPIAFDEAVQFQSSIEKRDWESYQIKTQGTFTQTHQLTDLALTEHHYFQVQNEQGFFYTRRGDFKINSEGALCTATGDILMGQGGAILVGSSNFTVDSQGGVFLDNQKVDQINIVQFQDQNVLRYQGQGLYQTDETPYPSESTRQVLQGFLEQSNVKSMDEMMELLKTSRHFEANQRIMRTADSLLSTAVNQLGAGNE